MPATITYVVNLESDLSDTNLADNIPKADNTGGVSLRAVIEQWNATGNPNDTCRIEFANPTKGGDGLPPAPLPMTIPLASQLPAIPAGREYVIYGSSAREVTSTRDPDANANTKFRFLEVNGGKLELSGLKLTGADNRGGSGGALASWMNSTTKVTNCYFASNTAQDGGAIANQGLLSISTPAGAELQTEFRGNTSEGFGGAIFSGGGGLPNADIRNTLFSDNAAGVDVTGLRGTHKGGAIASNLVGLLSVSGCTFHFNKAQEGGAIYADAPPAPAAPPGQLTFSATDCTFESNHAIQPPGGALPLAKGGAVYSAGNNARMTGCAFQGNHSGGHGGGVFQQNGWLVLDTCTFVNNLADDPLASHDVANKVGVGQPSSVALINTPVVVVMV